jgi:hypothetical protein
MKTVLDAIQCIINQGCFSPHLGVGASMYLSVACATLQQHKAEGSNCKCNTILATVHVPLYLSTYRYTYVSIAFAKRSAAKLKDSSFHCNVPIYLCLSHALWCCRQVLRGHGEGRRSTSEMQHV